MIMCASVWFIIANIQYLYKIQFKLLVRFFMHVLISEQSPLLEYRFMEVNFNIICNIRATAFSIMSQNTAIPKNIWTA